MYDLLHDNLPDDVELLTDFQLQIEHAMDLEQRSAVVFIDASLSAEPPFQFYPLAAARDHSYTSHAMSPVSVLDVFQQIHQQQAPASYMLTIRGYQFDLGQPLSSRAEDNLRHAFTFVKDLLATDIEAWSARVSSN